MAWVLLREARDSVSSDGEVEGGGRERERHSSELVWCGECAPNLLLCVCGSGSGSVNSPLWLVKCDYIKPPKPKNHKTLRSHRDLNSGYWIQSPMS